MSYSTKSSTVAPSAISQPTKKCAKSPGRPPARDMVWIPGGSFQMGSNDHYPEEAPAHQATVDGFWIDKYLVTNAQFQKFVKETQFVTFAEKTPNPEDYPGAKPELLVPASVVFKNPTSALIWATTITGGPMCKVQIGGIPMAPAVQSKVAKGIQSCISPIAM